MPEKVTSADEAKATLPERIERPRAAGPEGGLAGIAGGWEGSEELARILDTSSRVGRREAGTPD